MIITNTQERTRFLRFAFVGVIGAVVDFSVFNLCAALIGIPAVIASMISFLAAVASNFLWNRYWTYPDSRSKKVQHQVVQFMVVSLIGLAVRTLLFSWLEPRVINFFRGYEIPAPLTPVLLGHNFALATVIIVIMFWNFFANRYWTYSDVSSS
jgi:putative flippase GtrA